MRDDRWCLVARKFQRDVVKDENMDNFNYLVRRPTHKIKIVNCAFMIAHVKYLSSF